MEEVILVDSNDNEIGMEEKFACHRRPAKLHRAFSVFILNSKNQLMIHRRAMEKKTWPGYWTNTCCSHPRKDEPAELAAKRRLQEELGFSCDLKFLFKFEYKADYDEEWGENELDYVFFGYYDGIAMPNRHEIMEVKLIPLDELEEHMKEHPEKFTPWFKICFNRFRKSIKK